MCVLVEFLASQPVSKGFETPLSSKVLRAGPRPLDRYCFMTVKIQYRATTSRNIQSKTRFRRLITPGTASEQCTRSCGVKLSR